VQVRVGTDNVRDWSSVWRWTTCWKPRKSQVLSGILTMTPSARRIAPDGAHSTRDIAAADLVLPGPAVSLDDALAARTEQEAGSSTGQQVPSHVWLDNPTSPTTPPRRGNAGELRSTESNKTRPAAGVRAARGASILTTMSRCGGRDDITHRPLSGPLPRCCGDEQNKVLRSRSHMR